MKESAALYGGVADLPRAHPAGRPRALGWFAIAAVGVLMMQAAWIAALPPFRAIDEFDHAFRAASVARGHWVASETARHGRGDLVVAPDSLVQAAHDQCKALKYTGKDNCTPVTRADAQGNVLIASAASRYNPAFYWYVGTMAMPFEGATALQAMRVAAALLCALFIVMSIWALRSWATNVWPALGLIVAITPVLMYSTVVPAPNAVEIAGGLLVWCSLLGLNQASVITQGRLLLLAIPGVFVLSCVRYLGPLFLALILAFVWQFIGWSRLREVAKARPLHAVALLGAVVCGVTVGVGWTLAARTTVLKEPLHAPIDWGQIFASVPVWLFQAVAAFPYRNERAPVLVYAAYLAVFLAFVLLGVIRGWLRSALSLVALALVMLFMPVVLSALSYPTRGAIIWQGRYGLPVAVGMCVMAGTILQAAPLTHRLVPPVVVAAFGALGVGQVVGISALVMAEVHKLPSANDPNWHHPTPVLVGTLTAIGWTLLVVASVRLISRGDEEQRLSPLTPSTSV